jgi:hypothetical protein
VSAPFLAGQKILEKGLCMRKLGNFGSFFNAPCDLVAGMLGQLPSTLHLTTPAYPLPNRMVH